MNNTSQHSRGPDKLDQGDESFSGRTPQGCSDTSRDKKGEGRVCEEGMWRLFLGCMEGRPLPFFLSSPPSFPEEMKESGGKKD